MAQPTSSIPQPRCCCGEDACPYLVHTGTLLEGLERDVRLAAQLGQALLVRHESYMADASAERARMSATIEQLAHDKKELEARNAATIEENRSLLDQLEYLNNTVAESDDHIRSLTATLRSTQQELQRLTVLASRTKTLERQLAELEREQASLHETLGTTAENERNAVQRWRKAERTIADLQDQVDRIEREAKEEHERHVEVVGRMERRRAVERELGTAAGRWSGAAAAETLDRDKNGSNVVSHFVKDILQDNANLQLGVVELRELLLASNDEVERLREQLMLHQPLDHIGGGEQAPSLQRELGFEPVLNQALHVHHHYHAPANPTASASTKSRTPLQRRVKKKRTVASPGLFAPPSGTQTPRSAVPGLKRTTPPLATPLLAQTSVTLPPRGLGKGRWSTQSNQTGPSVAASSAPSSPYKSSNRTSSLFDRMFSDVALDSSSPTSPEESEAPDSPKCEPLQTNPPPIEPLRSFSTLGAAQAQSRASVAVEDIEACALEEPQAQAQAGAAMPDLALTPSLQATISKENGDETYPDPDPDPDPDSKPTPTPSTDRIISESIHAHIRPRPPLRRAASHDSLLSIHGLDIPTFPTFPSRPSRPSLEPRISSASAAGGPVLSATTATAARPALARRAVGSSELLAGLAAERRGLRKRGSDRTLGQKVGGWVWGRWGGSPVSASPRASLPIAKTTAAALSAIAERTAAGDKMGKASPQPEKVPRPRPPGVNQRSPILGLGPEVKAPCKVTVEALDVEALRESLGEG